MDDGDIRAVPKADLHLHQEMWPRLERLAASRAGRTPFDWRAEHPRVANVPPGVARLEAIYEPDRTLDLAGAPDDAEDFVARVAETIREAAEGGAVLVEVRFGSDQIDRRADFMSLFRRAEGLVQLDHPDLVAEAIGYVQVGSEPPERELARQHVDACVRAAGDGLAGVDFSTTPYDRDAGPAVWDAIDGFAEEVTAAGLGTTSHAGEFSVGNLERAVAVPHVRRLGHAVHAPSIPGLVDRIRERGITIECCLASNLVLGAVASYEAHPIGELDRAGVLVTLNTDLPAHLCTSIEAEYAAAAALGFTVDDLRRFTGNAVAASFTSDARRAALLARLS